MGVCIKNLANFMFKCSLPSLFIFCIFSFNALAMKGDNPFAKNETLNIGKDINWIIDKKVVSATKTVSDEKGSFYHLRFDNKTLGLQVSGDKAAVNPRSFAQFEIKDVKIDGKQSPLFNWCLNNQQRHNRFLQQGLKVKQNTCSIDGKRGSFVMTLNEAALSSLQQGNRLKITLKPFRTPLELNYDISDFKDMYLALNTKVEPVPVVAPVEPAVKKIDKKCWAGPPAKYKNIKSVEYHCADSVAKKDAEAWVIKLVKREKVKKQQLAAEKKAKKEQQRKLKQQKKQAELKKQKVLAEKQQQAQVLQAETAAIAASQAKQAQIGDEITQKMVKVCDKFWSKGEHRCYCQKYIKHAPSEIQAKSICE